MLPTLDRSVAAVRRRRLANAWTQRFGAHLAAALFAAGAVLLALRFAAGWERGQAAWWLALAAFAPLSAWWFARRSVPSASGATTWLDVHGGASGMVVTERELGPNEWSNAARGKLAHALEELPQAPLGRALLPVAPAAAFCALALWFDPPQPVVGPPPAVAGAAVERVESEIAALREQVELEPELARELEQRLEQIKARAEEGSAQSTFEALDRLEERLAAQAKEAEQRAQQTARDLADAANNPSLSDAQASLDEALKSLQQSGLGKDLPKTATEGLQPGTLALPKGVQLDSAQLARLANGLKGALDGKLGELAKAGLLDPKALAKAGELEKLGEVDPAHVCDQECLKPGGT